LQNNKTNIVPAGKRVYCYIVFEGENPDRFTGLNSVDDESGSFDDIVFVDEEGNQNEVSLIESDQAYGSLLAISSDSVYEIVESLVTIYISS